MALICSAVRGFADSFLIRFSSISSCVYESDPIDFLFLGFPFLFFKGKTTSSSSVLRLRLVFLVFFFFFGRPTAFMTSSGCRSGRGSFSFNRNVFMGEGSSSPSFKSPGLESGGRKGTPNILDAHIITSSSSVSESESSEVELLVESVELYALVRTTGDGLESLFTSSTLESLSLFNRSSSVVSTFEFAGNFVTIALGTFGLERLRSIDSPIISFILESVDPPSESVTSRLEVGER
mmetsp:Transcript_33763/g.81857  ORF Transcript_33763/g.81857 Transcript_33763/m.81857 type:complete len:236 (-) Transcript_33763:2163-2870(-)